MPLWMLWSAQDQWDYSIDSKQCSLSDTNVMMRKWLSASLALCEENPPVTGGFPSQMANDMELWCFLCCEPDKLLNKQVKLQVIWDTMILTWCHYNGKIYYGLWSGMWHSMVIMAQYIMVLHTAMINILCIAQHWCGYNKLQSSAVITWCNLLRYYPRHWRQQQNLNQTSNSQQTPYTSPSQARYGVFIIRISKKIDRVITAPHCTLISQ